MYALINIAGGDYSDWLRGTGEYDVPAGYTAYAFQPGSSGATINAAKWLKRSGSSYAETAVTDTYKSKWFQRSITAGPLVFADPITSITLSAGDGMLYLRKDQRTKIT